MFPYITLIGPVGRGGPGGRDMTLVPRRGEIIPVPPALDAPVVHDGLTQDEYKALRNAMPSHRDRLITMTLRNTGLRIGELLKVEKRHTMLSGPDYIIYIQRSKKRREVEYEPIYLTPDLGANLSDYIRAHQLREIDKIFGNESSQRSGEAITQRGYDKVLRKTAAAVLGRPVSSKELRKLYIQDMVDGGIPMEVAAKMVGHEDPRTTARHYYGLTADRRKAIGERIEV